MGATTTKALMYKYEVEIECDEGHPKYAVIEWYSLGSIRVGKTVYRDNVLANCMAMAEEYQYNAECHEWALNNNQESEFDYV
jgi:hypothetical protein